MKIKIEKLTHGGSGIGEIDGKKVFVPFSAPGDLLDVEIIDDHDSFAVAQVVSLEEESPCRVTPKCPVFGKCGGCQWQHISYESQLKWKKIILSDSLERIGKIENPNVLNTLPSPKEWNYRNRIQLHIDSKGHVGFYRPNSKEIVEFDECVIAEDKLNHELKLNRTEFSKRDRGVALRLNDDDESFAQINTGQNENLKKLIIEWLKDRPNEIICELHAGSGNFTFELAKIAKRVVASDIDGRAIRTAVEKQQRLDIRNIEFVCAPANRATKRLHGLCDAVLVDPPRKGCAEAIDAIVALKPKTILYISCNPATLARDISTLKTHGFELVKTLPVDMFPQTFHIESLSILQSN